MSILQQTAFSSMSDEFLPCVWATKGRALTGGDAWGVYRLSRASYSVRGLVSDGTLESPLFTAVGCMSAHSHKHTCEQQEKKKPNHKSFVFCARVEMMWTNANLDEIIIISCMWNLIPRVPMHSVTSRGVPGGSGRLSRLTWLWMELPSSLCSTFVTNVQYEKCIIWWMNNTILQRDKPKM